MGNEREIGIEKEKSFSNKFLFWKLRHFVLWLFALGTFSFQLRTSSFLFRFTFYLQSIKRLWAHDLQNARRSNLTKTSSTSSRTRFLVSFFFIFTSVSSLNLTHLEFLGIVELRLLPTASRVAVNDLRGSFNW